MLYIMVKQLIELKHFSKKWDLANILLQEYIVNHKVYIERRFTLVEKRENGASAKELLERDKLGKKFEDLTPEEMQKIQGSGDMQTEGSLELIFSKPPYICRRK